MKNIELYDIITLDDNSEYTILKMLKEQEKTYYLLAPVNKEEEPDMEALKIVEVKEEEGQIIIDEDLEEDTQKKLAKQFLTSLREGIE